MSKKIFLVLAWMGVFLWSAASEAKFQARPIPVDKRVAPTQTTMPAEKAFCVIQNDDGITAYFNIFNPGDGVAVFMDPSTCGPSPYPFRVTDAHFYLYDHGSAVWPVEIQINVRDMAGPDSCDGPGDLICSETFRVPVDSAYPNLIHLDLSPLCCVYQPFFLELILTGGSPFPFPSPLFTDSTTNPTDTCNNWMFLSGSYVEWHDFWQPNVSNVVLRASGNTQDIECDTSWYWKPPYEDYAPNGMPDIDQKQNNWFKIGTGEFTFCGPVAVANCFKWFDSKYNVPPGFPGDGVDMFPLVRDYMDGNPPFIPPLWDDHDPWNVEHWATPWVPPAIPAPPPTAQPFFPGPQPQPSGMPAWGELVERLAWFFDTDGIQSGYCQFSGTHLTQMQLGIDAWFASETFPDGSTLADTLCEVTTPRPTFAYVESLVEKSEDVILLLGFWYQSPTGEWLRVGGHYVTVAGVNSEQFMIAFSDPFIDNAELGGPGRVGDGVLMPHLHAQHDATVHNDEGNVSHDVYLVDTVSVSPGGDWWLPDYPVNLDPLLWTENFNAQNVPDEFLPVTEEWDGASPLYTEVEYCVHISPWDYRGDVTGDGMINSADVVFLINYLFIGGPAPTPLSEGDVNCDGTINSADIIFLLNYLFLNGPVSRCCDP